MNRWAHTVRIRAKCYTARLPEAVRMRYIFTLKVQNQSGIYIARALRCSRVPAEQTGGPTMSLDFGSLWGDDEPKRKSVSKFLRKAVWDRDGGKCQLCGKPADPFDFDLAHNRAH